NTSVYSRFSPISSEPITATATMMAVTIPMGTHGRVRSAGTPEISSVTAPPDVRTTWRSYCASCGDVSWWLRHHVECSARRLTRRGVAALSATLGRHGRPRRREAAALVDSVHGAGPRDRREVSAARAAMT